jgi:hypothetical protein
MWRIKSREHTETVIALAIGLTLVNSVDTKIGIGVALAYFTGHYFIFNELLEAFLDREENMQKFQNIKEKVKNLNHGYCEFIAKGQFSV